MGKAVSVKSFPIAVTTAGTRKSLSNSKVISSYGVIVKAKSSNTSDIYVGGDDVVAGDFTLAPGAAVRINNVETKAGPVPVYLDTIWIDAAVSGEGVEVLCEDIVTRIS